MPLHLVGFFEELPHGGPSGGRLAAATRPAPGPDQARVVDYLRRGTVLMRAWSMTVDVLAPGAPRMEPLQLLTDGTWEWPNDLAHFVEHYNAELPGAFVEHMRAHSFEPPALRGEAIESILREQQAGMSGL